MKRISYVAIVILCFVLLAATYVIAKTAPNAVTLKVEYTWKSSDNCSSDSPEIKVTGIPAATKKLNVTLTDLDVPSFDHGGGTVECKATKEVFIIPRGALKRYTGPCPPSGQHTYSIEVKAIDDKGVIVGTGKKEAPCCP
jgi:phosphatidylethanolamine-binding protein (PEBP) family uncharacterized protein